MSHLNDVHNKWRWLLEILSMPLKTQINGGAWDGMTQWTTPVIVVAHTGFDHVLVIGSSDNR